MKRMRNGPQRTRLIYTYNMCKLHDKFSIMTRKANTSSKSRAVHNHLAIVLNDQRRKEIKISFFICFHFPLENFTLLCSFFGEINFCFKVSS